MQIASSDATSKFRELLDATENHGKTFVITRWGRPVAVLAPYVDPPEEVESASRPTEDSGAPSLGLADRDSTGTVSAFEIAREEVPA